MGTLEHRLGAKLFERDHAGIRPTPAGERFLEEATLGFDHLQRAMQRVGALQRGEHGELTVGVKVLVDGVFKAIADAAAAGEEISLPGFGKFKVKSTPEREGRNPSTGATIKIAAAKKLTFTPAKALKDSLNS